MIDISLESVSYAGKDLFTKLTEMVHFLRVDGTYSTDAIKQTLFNDIVKRHTGMNVNLMIIDFGLEMNAYASIPDLNRNHVFSKLYGGLPLRNNEGTRILEMMEENHKKATVNLSTGMVGGFYSDMPLDVVVFLGLIKNTTYTNAEVAAIILHELGHHFTYFQYINTVGYGGLVSILAAKEISGVNTKEERMDKIILANKVLGIDKKTSVNIDTEQDLTPEDVQVVMFGNYLTSTYSSTGTIQYDFRNCEQLADMFAAKHGAARDFVTGMDKMDRLVGDRSQRSKATFIIVETCKLILFVLGISSIVFAPIALMSLIVAQPSGYKTYDDPKARVGFVRRQIIASIQDVKRSSNPDNKVLDTLIADLEVVTEVMDSINDHRTLVELFWQSLPGPASNLRKQEMAAKQLETMLFNDLEYQSTRFELLTK